MRIPGRLAMLLLLLTVAACSSIETQPAATDVFAAGKYQYYRWRSVPLASSADSKDPAYLADPILRREVNSGLAAKGYILDNDRAQFSVDYIYASGLRIGERSRDISNVSPHPSATPNRQVNQAAVDNAYALGGVKETANIALQFNDIKRNQEVWQVIISRIVENVNKIDVEELHSGLKKGVKRALRPLPEAQ